MQARTAIHSYLGVLERSGASRSTRRQREWALNQALTAAALQRIHGDVPTEQQVREALPEQVSTTAQRIDVTEIISEEFAAWFLPWAATGILAAKEGAAKSQAASRARAAALRALALANGSAPITHTEPAVQLRTPTPMNARALRHVAFDLVAIDPPSKAAVRMAAMLGVMITTPLRPVDLCQMTVDDVRSTADGTVTIPALPLAPDQPVPAGYTGRETMDQALGRLLEKWLEVRQVLVSRLEGSPPNSLWVSVRASPTDEGVIRPAGLPLHPRGLERSYVGQAKNFNAELAAGSRTSLPLGRDGVPVSHLPLSFDHLRRSLQTLEESDQLG
ncbi:site-specific integrase [Kineosporia rhizophila]|uniref:site-specific integrase n=1 Tax=Kineosporia rhizophila TaxID=84633 RepID=UPI001E43002E|nr:site-specific integrase [Kineosporia rhizophila]MCE0539556.1 site-specific integrase [Kineosporia rhizophila]